MRRLLIVVAALVLVAAFSTSGWLLLDSRSREQALAQRVESLEAGLEQRKSADLDIDVVTMGTANALQRVEALEKAAFYGHVPTSVRAGGALSHRMTVVETDLDMLRDQVEEDKLRVPVVDTTEADISRLRFDLGQLEDRVSSVCRVLQANVEQGLFC